MGILDAKVAIVTGAGNGIGRSHAHHLASLGAKVVVNDLGGSRDGSGQDAKAADLVVAEIQAKGGQAVADYSNVAQLEGAHNLVFSALNRFGRLDILVNNAGILRDKTLLNLKENDFDAVIAVHLKGTFLCLQSAARQMKLAGQGGRIINTTSMSGLIGNFGQANYSAAKAGIFGLTLTAAMELAKAKITVNAIAPIALTRMTQDLAVMQGANESDLGPQHISPVVGFLASELAANITGKVFGVQGRRIFEYRMGTSNGVTSSADWNAESIKERFAEICA